MAEPAQQPWTIEAFCAWQERQRDRYALVGGRPVRMMAGARNVHDDIVVNLVGELRDQLRGGPCRPFTSDGSLDYTLFVEPNAPEVIVWERSVDRDWSRHAVTGLDATIELPAIAVSLILRDVYEGVEFVPRPRLVRGEAGDRASAYEDE